MTDITGPVSSTDDRKDDNDEDVVLLFEDGKFLYVQLVDGCVGSSTQSGTLT